MLDCESFFLDCPSSTLNVADDLFVRRRPGPRGSPGVPRVRRRSPRRIPRGVSPKRRVFPVRRVRGPKGNLRVPTRSSALGLPSPPKRPIDRVHVPPGLTYPTYPTHRHLTRDRRSSSSAAPAASASSSSPNSSRLATSSARRRAIPNPRVRSSAPTTISSCAPRTYATPPRSPRRGYATASTPWCRARAPQRSRAPGGRMATDRKTPISSEHQTS